MPFDNLSAISIRFRETSSFAFKAEPYFEGGNVEQRMNGICAGGTGSFIDQMASLLQTDASGLNEYAKNYQSLYTRNRFL